MSLLLPDKIKKVITEIRVEPLLEKGIKGLLLDVDNTLSTQGGQIPLEGLEAWLSNMRQAGFQVMILSNAFKKRVRPFAEKLGLPYKSFSVKPFPFGYIRACKKMKLDANEVAMIGDQIITDVLGGNLCGLFTILVMPLRLETSWTAKLKRRFEGWLLNKHGLKP